MKLLRKTGDVWWKNSSHKSAVADRYLAWLNVAFPIPRESLFPTPSDYVLQSSIENQIELMIWSLSWVTSAIFIQMDMGCPHIPWVIGLVSVDLEVYRVCLCPHHGREGHITDSAGKGLHGGVRTKLIYQRDPFPISSKVGHFPRGWAASSVHMLTLMRRVEVDLEDVKLARLVRLREFWTQCRWAKHTTTGARLCDFPEVGTYLAVHAPPRMQRELGADACNVYTGSVPSILAPVFFLLFQANDFMTSAGDGVCLLPGIWVCARLFEALRKSRVWGGKEVTCVPTSHWKSVSSERMGRSSGCLSFRLLPGGGRGSFIKMCLELLQTGLSFTFPKTTVRVCIFTFCTKISSCSY